MKPKTKKSKKVAPKKKVARETRVVVQVAPQVQNQTMELFEPMRDGKKMTLAPTWLNQAQLLKIVQRTPANETYKRQGKGGKSFTYVTGNYIIKALNFSFGWNWDFEVMSHGIEKKQIWVMGRLTVKSSDGKHTITKTQFGRADIKFLRDGTGHVDFGNDLKAASTDAMKKCASMLGIASDIYGKIEYKEEANVEIVEARDHKDIVDEANQSVDEHEKIVGPDNTPTFVCAVCKDPISDIVANYSTKMFKKKLCREHQPKKK